ncbi:unnamed protein product [Prunus armeniaca]
MCTCYKPVSDWGDQSRIFRFFRGHVFGVVFGHCVMVRDGYFGFKDYFQSLCDTVDGGKDFYLLGSDFESNLEAQAAVDKAFADPNKWTQMSILSTAGSGIFSRQNNLRLRGEDLGN